MLEDGILRRDFNVGRNTVLGNNVAIDDTALVGDNAVLEDDVQVGRFARVEDGVTVKRGAVIEDHAIVGYRNLTRKKQIYRDYPTVIGEDALVRSGAVVYWACTIGKRTWVNHHAVLRENTDVGDDCIIGNLVMCEGYTRIGNQVAVHALCGLGGNMLIEDKVFMATNVVTANGRRPTYLRNMPAIEDKGPTIRFGARIGISVVLLPGIEVGREALVASGSIVTRDVPAFAVVMGSPAKVVGSVPREEWLES